MSYNSIQFTIRQQFLIFRNVTLMRLSKLKKLFLYKIRKDLERTMPDFDDKEKPSIKKMQIMKWFSMPSYSLEEEEESKWKLKHSDKSEGVRNLGEGKDVIDLSQFGKVKDGYPYIQMKLSGDRIDQEFEKALQTRVSNDVEIREATEQDIPVLVELYNRAFLTANDPYAPMTETNMRTIFEYNNTVILIGKIWGKDAGFIIIDFEGENQEIGIIAGLGTLPQWQQRGVGTSLGVKSWKYFKEHDVKELKCEVYSKNLGSYRLIKGMGFEAVDVKYYDLKNH